MQASSAGACLRELGYPRISSGARSRLRPSAVWLNASEPAPDPKGPQGRLAAAPCWRDSQASGCPRRRLRLNQTNQSLLRPFAARSEEHTSELQSLMPISTAGFCLKTTYTD